MMELVIGGSGSGKSAYAEEAVCREHRQLFKSMRDAPPLYYIADMIPRGPETERKIEEHRRMREGKGFTTLEWYLNLPGKLSNMNVPAMADAAVLFECISNLTANEMYEPGGAGEGAAESIIQGVHMLRDRCAHLVVVTNDVFRESIPDTEEMHLYKKNLGRINRELAELADKVTEVVCGIPVSVKSGSRTFGPGGAAGTGNRETQTLFQQKEQGMEQKAERGNLIFVTGGAYQGKSDYAAQLLAKIPGVSEMSDGAVCPLEMTESCGAVDHFHLFVRRWLQAGKGLQELIRSTLDKSRDLLIVCDEIGCGLVPVDAFEREYREAVGCVCTELARYADEVYRVTCGIAVRLR